MKSISKKALTALSASTLAAGMAHGDILYTNMNQTVVGSGGDSVQFDLNQDGFTDYNVEFDNNNNLKPYVDDSPEAANGNPATGYVLGDASDDGGKGSGGLPVTPAGTPIDGNYESLATAGYFLEDKNANLVGGWTNAAGNIQGYVGLELDDTEGTHFGWAQFIYNQNVVTNGIKGTLTLIDCAMETQVGVTILAGENAEPGLPSVYRSPLSQTNYPGGTAQFDVVGIGNPAPTYQWMAGAVGSGVYTNLTDGGNISGSTTASLTISNLTFASAADYVVVLSNANGSVTNTVPARLSFVPGIITGLTPSPVELYSGVNASIQVQYGSSAPNTSFQWRKNGVNLSDGNGISGTASQTLVLSNTVTGESGQYSVVLSNTYGAVTSMVDNVTITTPEAPYQQAVLALAPVSLYSFSETNDPASSNAIAYDLIGGHNGIYGAETANGNANYDIAGPRPTDGFLGFSPANTAFQPGATNNLVSTRVIIPAMNLNSNTCTFTAWIYPTDNGPDYGVVLTFRGLAAGTANGINLSPDGSLGYHWNDNQYSYQSELFPPVDQWSFVALVITPSGATFYLCDGTGASLAITNATDSVSLPSQALANPGAIGGDTVDPNFLGSIDEVALFNYALTASQITNLYNVAVTGTNSLPVVPILTIQPAGGSIVLNWTSGVLLQAPDVTGPWTVNSSATSPYTVPITGGQMFYRARSQ